MSGQGATESLHFDGFTLDRRGLFRLDPMGAYVPVALGARALDLLLLLATHDGAVVSKRDLIAEVWSGTAVEDSNLTKQISALRRALDRSPGVSCIQTVSGRGYRFVAAVTRTEHAIAPPPTIPERPGIAVLPFRNLMVDPEHEYFVDGVVEEIAAAIGHYSWLLVVARGETFRYKGKPVDVRRTARELGVRYLLEGSVRKAASWVRITAELSDTATGAHIWGDRFDGALDDIFDLQDRVASAIAGAIEPKLRLAEVERAGRKPTENLDAYDFYMRGQAQAYRRTQEGMAASIELARQALELDPGYGLAMARIALSRGMQRLRQWIPPSGPEVEEGIMMARRAIAAAANDHWALDFAGLALAQLAGDNVAALSAIERAIVLNPNFAVAIGHRAIILAYLNRPDEAIPMAHRAIQLSPLDPAMFSFCSALALAYLTVGDYEEGLRWAEESLRENSGMTALRLKISLCGHLGRHAEVCASLQRVQDLHSEPTIPGVLRGIPKGIAPEIVALVVDGLRKAGLPEQ